MVSTQNVVKEPVKAHRAAPVSVEVPKPPPLSSPWSRLASGLW